MEKGKFIQVAPAYYALAICVAFRESGNLRTREEIEAHFQYREDDNFEPETLLSKMPVFEAAISWLAERGMIDSLLDDFGPPIYRRTDRFDDGWHSLADQEGIPFHKYNAIVSPAGWLRDALFSLNHTFEHLGITPEDFKDPETEWQPLPLERSDAHLAAVIQTLDETITLVRSDNGYGVAHPEERAYVLSGLSNTLATLKDATSTSVVFLRVNALEPLARLARRFGNAAIGIAADATKEAIVEFLKQFGTAVVKHFIGGG